MNCSFKNCRHFSKKLDHNVDPIVQLGERFYHYDCYKRSQMTTLSFEDMLVPVVTIFVNIVRDTVDKVLREERRKKGGKDEMRL